MRGELQDSCGVQVAMAGAIDADEGGVLAGVLEQEARCYWEASVWDEEAALCVAVVEDAAGEGGGGHGELEGELHVPTAAYGCCTDDGTLQNAVAGELKAVKEG